MTMPPGVIEGLMKMNMDASIKLAPEIAKKIDVNKISVDEKNFRWLVNQDEIGNEKICEGIRLFSEGIP